MLNLSILTTSYPQYLKYHNMSLLDYFTQFSSAFSIALIIGSIVWLIGAYFTAFGFYVTKFGSKFPDMFVMFMLSLLYGVLVLAIAYSPIMFPTTGHIWGTVFAFALTVIIPFSSSSCRIRSLVSFVNASIHLATSMYLESAISFILAAMFFLELVYGICHKTKFDKTFGHVIVFLGWMIWNVADKKRIHGWIGLVLGILLYNFV